MATQSICITYELLAKSGDWMNNVDIADKGNIAIRSSSRAGAHLVDGGAAEEKTVNKRKYYRLLPGHAEIDIVKDIIETNRIKSL